MSASDHSGDGRPPVEAAEPPKALGYVIGPVMRALLRSPLHGLVSKQLMLLAFSGCKSGKRYEVVVGRHELGDTLVVPSASRWRFNLRGGAPVEVMLGGIRRVGRAELVEEPDEVALVYEALLERVGLKGAQRVGLRVNVDRKPTREELKAALAGHGAICVMLER